MHDMVSHLFSYRGTTNGPIKCVKTYLVVVIYIVYELHVAYRVEDTSVCKYTYV